MPIVFVHGVNTRESPAYRARKLMIEEFLQRHLGGCTLGGKTLPATPTVTFPYWGDLATTFAWNMASLPLAEMEVLGAIDDAGLDSVLGHLQDATAGPVGDEPLKNLALADFRATVDLVVHLAIEHAAEGLEEEMATFAVAASAYADAHPTPDWADGVANDRAFLAELNRRVAPTDGAEALGGFGDAFRVVSRAAARLRNAVRRLGERAVDEVGDFASTRLLAAHRSSLNGVLGRFFGDVFIYFNGRGEVGAPGEIPARVLAAFDVARASAPDEPLVIVGHSLGGVITFDLLSHYRPDLAVALVVSVGSQVAHFEEIKLFHASDPDVKSPRRASKPASIRRWINIYDEVDVFSYAAERVFEGVDVDAQYDTGTYVGKAHGAYFEQNRFYERLRARIDALPAVV